VHEQPSLIDDEIFGDDDVGVHSRLETTLLLHLGH